MSTEPENQPAFPCDTPPTIAELDLRDWFAGKALQGMLAYQPAETLASMAAINDELFVKRAYALADAMLAARQKGAI